ncbi:hypothetical protein PspLS_09578, partial [Pyricularia sp. CBS 133598]
PHRSVIQAAMIVRGFSKCASRLRPTLSTSRASIRTHSRAQCRSFTGSSSAGAAAGPSTNGPTTTAGLLAPFTTELDKIAPSFRIHGSQIRILQTPAEFYETLKDKIRHAERRIFLSTLYIGKSEKELIATLQEALRAKPELKVSILTDALRGSREAPEPCSASLLAPLVTEFGAERVEIRMYHTPNLTGLRKKYIPKRINEGWGLQHMKLYGFDDEIVMSGANLSNDYFTNRQDRYHLFSSREITEYFWGLQRAVGSLSFLVQPSTESPSGFEMTWPGSNLAPSPLEEPDKFVAKSTTLIRDLISVKSAKSNAGSGGERSQTDTSVYPLAQMSQLMRPDTSTELPAVTHILSKLASPALAGSSWTFTAGYFNPAPSLTKLLLSAAPGGTGTVITASPYANGFFRSRGVSGMLPDAYSLLARRFLDQVERRKGGQEVVLKEWRRGTSGEPDGWTYHAKGLWVTLPGGQDIGPSLTMVGSSNYTKRSYSLDLEANALIVTTNDGLRKRLADEQQWLQEYAAPVTIDDFVKTDRRVSLKVRISMWIVSLVGGAL